MLVMDMLQACAVIIVYQTTVHAKPVQQRTACGHPGDNDNMYSCHSPGGPQSAGKFHKQVHQTSNMAVDNVLLQRSHVLSKQALENASAEHAFSLLQTDPKAQQYRPWSVDNLVSPQDPMNDPTWVKDLGRGLTLGGLYDMRTDQPIPGYMFVKNAVEKRKRVVNTPYTALEMVNSDTLKDKFKLASVESSLSMSLMVGFVEMESGATAKYLSDKAQSSRTSRVSMNYMTRTHTEYLDLYDQELKQSMYHEPISNGLATHVVTGVLWGGNCFAIFEADTASSEEKLSIQSNLSNMVKVNTPLIGLGSTAGVDLSNMKSIKHTSEKTTVRIYGDHVPTEPIPTQVDKALEYIQKIPKTISSKPVPVAVQLFPLSKLDTKASRLRQLVNDYSIDAALGLFMELDELEVMVKDLSIIQEDGFVLWKQNVQAYLAQLQNYRASMTLRLGAALKGVRGGTMPQDVLLEPVREHRNSDFSKNRVSNRVQIFSDQIYNLKAWVRVLLQDGVTVAYAFSDFTAKTFDGDYDDVYALIFKGMNPSADRKSSMLMRRFRSFAAKRKHSKTQAFVFIHYDSFEHQFKVEAAMKTMERSPHEQNKMLHLLEAGKALKAHGGADMGGELPDQEELLPGWKKNEAGYLHEATGSLVEDSLWPHTFPPHPAGSLHGELDPQDSSYEEIGETLWLQGESNQNGQTFFWNPQRRHFSWEVPKEVKDLLMQQRSQEKQAAVNHDFEEAKRLHNLEQMEESAFRTAEDLQARIALAAETRSYDHAEQLQEQLHKVRSSASLLTSAAVHRVRFSCCSSQGLSLEDLGCQALLPPQCRSRNLTSWSSAEAQLEQETCRRILELLPNSCFQMGVVSRLCKELLPQSCLGMTYADLDTALLSDECWRNLRARPVIAAASTCNQASCECSLDTNMTAGLCCDRKTQRTRRVSTQQGGWCAESPCGLGEFWCPDVSLGRQSGNMTAGRCVFDCVSCDGQRRQAVNQVCEQATPSLCYNEAGGLFHCPSSDQCMGTCASCAGFEVQDDVLHTCAKQPSPAICFDERHGLLFCPTTKTCVEPSRCQMDCVNKPKSDYVKRECSTGVTLTLPLAISGTPSRDTVRFEFEANAESRAAFSSAILLPRTFPGTITPAMLWREAQRQLSVTRCVLAAQEVPLKPRRVTRSLHGCSLEEDKHYNLWMALSDDAADPTDALLTVVPVLVPRPVSFASQVTATMEPSSGRLVVRFTLSTSVSIDPTSESSLLGWAWLLPSHLAACCVDAKVARLEPAALYNSIVGRKVVEESEKSLLKGLLHCSVQAAPIEVDAQVSWIMNCPALLQRASSLNVGLGVRVLAARDGLSGDGGTLTHVVPVALSPPCLPSEVSVYQGRFGCAHLPSVEDGGACEVVPDLPPGRCTHTHLICMTGQWATCRNPSGSNNPPTRNNLSQMTSCVFTTSVSCAIPTADQVRTMFETAWTVVDESQEGLNRIQKEGVRSLRQNITNNESAAIDVYGRSPAAHKNAGVSVRGIATEDDSKQRIHQQSLGFLQLSQERQVREQGFYGPVSITCRGSGRKVYAQRGKDNTDEFGATSSPIVTSDQLWRIISSGDGTYRIVNAYSGRIMFAQRNKDLNRGFVATPNDWNNAPDQYWRLVGKGDGTFVIINQDSGRRLYAEQGKHGKYGFGASIRADPMDIHQWKLKVECSATLYQNGDFTGWSATFAVGSYTASLLRAAGGHDNDAESIEVFGRGCSVVVYEEDFFSRTSKDFASWSVHQR